MDKIKQNRLLVELGLPLLALLLLTLLFYFSDIDMQLARYFYTPVEGWRFKDFWLWQLLYRRGMIPGTIIGVIGLGGLLIGWKLPQVRRQWRSYLLLLLLLAIGPGLLVNAIFKDHWGRTRPKHVIEFGGHLPFLKVWERGEPGASKSFPSGHASIGFYVMAPYFVLRKRRKKIAKGFLFGGTLYGILMGAGRLAQGGHFPSDVLWAWGIVYLTGIFLCFLLKPERLPPSD
ncbi:phosphatase PAP2 family protein [Malonomonas rubra]|uniref:phosphatase PAP2 family protein n=1 Tax=Malonomonas rubra TaxID=57040 RepID=UPI0026F089BB|nr:phosphatase PAP2 family protein [Malonomonas rubra]